MTKRDCSHELQRMPNGRELPCAECSPWTRLTVPGEDGKDEVLFRALIPGKPATWAAQYVQRPDGSLKRVET